LTMVVANVGANTGEESGLRGYARVLTFPLCDAESLLCLVMDGSWVAREERLWFSSLCVLVGLPSIFLLFVLFDGRSVRFLTRSRDAVGGESKVRYVSSSSSNKSLESPSFEIPEVSLMGVFSTDN